MYALIDTFNDREISQHKTLEACAKAQSRHLDRVRRANGKDSYLTYSVRHADGTKLTEAEQDDYRDAQCRI